MLRQAKEALPELETVAGDIITADLTQRYDAIFSSMVLHWLPDPLAALRHWQGWLKPHGKLFVALPMDGSFQEWRDACTEQGAQDRLWPLPQSGFADAVATRTQNETIIWTYHSAQDFLHTMKSTGAATPHPGKKQADIATMRKILKSRNRTMEISYRLIFLEAESLDASPCPPSAV